MTHIGGYPGRYHPRVRRILEADPPTGGLFICGHSHILKVMPDRKLDFLHINPGACGNQGWHQVRTLIRLTLEAGGIGGVEVIELGRRV
jgi:predicted phosphodiesterase